MKIQNCRACKARIIFLKTKSGNAMPVDADTVQEGDLEYDHTRHTSHFATCPSAAKFRKPKEQS